MTMKYFDHVFCILFFLFFCIKNKWLLCTTYPKREVPLKALESLFWEHPFLRSLQSLIVATPLGMSRVKVCVRLKWPTIYPCLLHDFTWFCCLFFYLCLEMFVWYFCLCYHVCSLRSLTIIMYAIKTTNMYAPLSTIWW